MKNVEKFHYSSSSIKNIIKLQNLQYKMFTLLITFCIYLKLNHKFLSAKIFKKYIFQNKIKKVTIGKLF